MNFGTADFILVLQLAVVAGAAIYLLQAACVFHHLRRKPRLAFAAEPVSILKPLCGDIEGLRENLESFAHLDYPRYEILLGVKSEQDSALPAARDFMRSHPHLPIRIVIDKREFGYNPKINNLIPMMVRARHDLILITDDNVRVSPDYLARTVSEMTAETGLVYNLIRGAGAKSLAAALENLHLNSFIIGSVCFLHKLLRHPCVIGKSMLMRRSTLQHNGGLPAVRNVLAEDYLLGRYFQKRGYRLALCSHAVTNVNQSWPLKKFLNRHMRWSKMRFWIGGYRYASEWLGNPVALAFVHLLINPGAAAALAMLLITTGKIFLDYVLAQKINAGMPLRYFLLTPLKDLLIAGLWFTPFCGRTVNWRGKEYYISRGSKLRARVKMFDLTDWQPDPLPVLSGMFSPLAHR